MLKKTITFTDYNDQPSTETLYFNLTKTEVIELQDIQPRLQAWTDRISGPERTLTSEELRELLDIIKTLIDRSYGQRSTDGKRFIKNPELVLEFSQTAAYDNFIFSLFENDGAAAIDFINGILPKDVVDAMASDTAKDGNSPVVIAELPKKPEDYTDAELISMSQEDFQNLVGDDPRKMPPRILQMAFQRKSKS